jgi:diacylglycerol kinase (ATP)
MLKSATSGRRSPARDRPVILVANPAAHGSRRALIGEAVRHLRGRGLTVEVRLTRGLGDGLRLAREAARERPRFVLAGGGDGTVNEVINGLDGSGVPVGLLPLGTMNVLARELGIPGTVEGSLKVVLEGAPRPVTLGRVVLTRAPEAPSRLFFMSAGVGFDASVVRGLNRTLRRWMPRTAHVASGLKVLSLWRPGELRVRTGQDDLRAYSLIASKTSLYAGSHPLAPGAGITSPDIHFSLIQGPERRDILSFLVRLLLRSHRGMRGVTFLESRRMEIEGVAPVQVDGEYIGETPALIESAPGAIEIIY